LPLFRRGVGLRWNSEVVPKGGKGDTREAKWPCSPAREAPDQSRPTMPS